MIIKVAFYLLKFFFIGIQNLLNELTINFKNWEES